jgi:hypothetical protein
MSNLCKAVPGITNETELNQVFPNSILPSAQQDRSANDGRLSNAALESIYNKLVAEQKLISNDRYKQILVNVTSQSDKAQQQRILESVGQQEKRTMESIQSEFCFYYVRYKFALEDLFETLARTSAGSSLTEAQKRTVETKINNAKNLNIKLNDLIQITNYISTKRASEMRDQNTTINMMNENIKDIYDRLRNQNTILRREDSITDLRRRMVEFTQEKNQSASNLLSLFGFLNLVALGLLFYMARS